MNEEAKKAKIKRFLQDKIMTESVFEVIRKTFLRPHGQKDVYLLAASRIAIDLLDEAYRELQKFSVEENKLEKDLTNPAL